MTEVIQDNTDQSKPMSYAILLLLSGISAIIVFPSIYICNFIPLPSMLLFPFEIVMPSMFGSLATALVIKLHRKLSDSSKINRELLTLIPLMFNLLSANTYFIVGEIAALGHETQKFSVLHNHHLTIKEESLIAPISIMSDYQYHAILHLENRSGFPIKRLDYYLVAFGEHDPKNIDLDTTGTFQNKIEAGYWEALSPYLTDVDIEVNIPLYSTVFNPLTCGDARLDKQLYISYQLDDYYGNYETVAVGDAIRQKIKQAVCSKPFYFLPA